jgi:hypothetical protein
MAEVCHYHNSPILYFDDIDNFGLWQNCFDGSIFEHLKKYIGRHQRVAGCGLRQFNGFGVFSSLDVLYGKPFEIIIHPSDEG